MPPRSGSPPKSIAVPSIALGRTLPANQWVLDRPVGADVEGLFVDVSWTESPDTTILPAADAAATRRSDSLLLDVRDALEPLPNEQLELEEKLGSGGMGVVWLSTQRCLGRKVAVKTLRDPSQGDDRQQRAAMQLLREARITGSLEHPNVVPVYDVRLDAEGRPRVMLKRIQGDEWLSLMHDEARVSERFGEPLLEWNLKVLLQVCNAVGFAHSRGILHRDLKPANVMIGEFGQVYLLDWGIAVGLRDDLDPSIPRAAEVAPTAGTPTYMAPEMVEASEHGLSERTDVYLLGAILFQIVAGHAPHQAPTLREVLESACRAVAMPASCPPELREVLARALARDPRDRYPSVEELRRDVSAAVSHRDAARVAADAEAQLDQLRALVANDASPSDVRKLFSACRFGFRASLMAWPDNAQARAGLMACIELMLDFELDQGQTDAANALASEIDDLPPALRERVQAAVAAAASARDEAHRLAQLGRHQDKRTGQGTRMLIAAALGSIWTIAPLAQLLLQAEEDSYSMIIGRSSVFVVVLAAMAYRARATMLETAINRHLIAGMALALVSQLFLTVGGVFLGLRPDQIMVLGIFVWFCFTTMFAVTTEPRLWPTAVAHLIAFLMASFVPDSLLYAMSAAKFALTINALVVWRPEPKAEARGEVQALLRTTGET
ncbi:MAG: serine/threonine protein kinase [Myxococcales bacterium]|nr:serine/threonine protein kinase [Myxococcales bacterium]